MEDLAIIFEAYEWSFVRRTRGYFMNNGRLIHTPAGEYVEVGERSMLVYLGNILFVKVGAYYAFDEESKLIDVAVWKEMDIP